MPTPVQPTRPLTSLPPFEVDGPYRRSRRHPGLTPRPLPTCAELARKQLNRSAVLALVLSASVIAVALLAPDALLLQVDAALRAALGLR